MTDKTKEENKESALKGILNSGITGAVAGGIFGAIEGFTGGNLFYNPLTLNLMLGVGVINSKESKELGKIQYAVDGASMFGSYLAGYNIAKGIISNIK